jgi:hypothetical protein
MDLQNGLMVMSIAPFTSAEVVDRFSRPAIAAQVRAAMALPGSRSSHFVE